MIHQIIVWGSYSVYICIGLAVWRCAVSLSKTLWIQSFWRVCIIIACSLFIWMRRVEVYWLRVQHHTINLASYSGPPLRIAVMSDMHVGMHKHTGWTRHLVSTLLRHSKDIDIVLIPGDRTYDAQETNLVSYLTPFRQLIDAGVPVYGVLGNHDVQKPGRPIRIPLTKTATHMGIIMMNNDIIQLDNNITLVGLGSHMNNEDNIDLLTPQYNNHNTSHTTIVLTHNPDTTLLYTDNMNADITIAGHTHGGQIRIPYIYQLFIPTRGNFDRGYYNISTHNRDRHLWISNGVGETHLPLRFLNRPTIDILTIQ